MRAFVPYPPGLATVVGSFTIIDFINTRLPQATNNFSLPKYSVGAVYASANSDVFYVVDLATNTIILTFDAIDYFNALKERAELSSPPINLSRTLVLFSLYFGDSYIKRLFTEESSFSGSYNYELPPFDSFGKCYLPYPRVLRRPFFGDLIHTEILQYPTNDCTPGTVSVCDASESWDIIDSTPIISGTGSVTGNYEASGMYCTRYGWNTICYGSCQITCESSGIWNATLEPSYSISALGLFDIAYFNEGITVGYNFSVSPIIKAPTWHEFDIHRTCFTTLHHDNCYSNTLHRFVPVTEYTTRIYNIKITVSERIVYIATKGYYHFEDFAFRIYTDYEKVGVSSVPECNLYDTGSFSWDYGYSNWTHGIHLAPSEC